MTPPAPELVEKVARALHEEDRLPLPAWDEVTPSTQTAFRAQARAVIPIIESALLRDLERWLDKNGWHAFARKEITLRDFSARERGLLGGEE